MGMPRNSEKGLNDHPWHSDKNSMFETSTFRHYVYLHVSDTGEGFVIWGIEFRRLPPNLHQAKPNQRSTNDIPQNIDKVFKL